MKTAIERKKIIDKLSSKFNGNNISSQTQTPNQNFINVNTNKTQNYIIEAENLLSGYMQNIYAVQLVDDIYNTDENYIKEFVINFNTDYQPILDGLRGSNVNINKIYDILIDKLKENEVKKLNPIKEIKKQNANISEYTDYFFTQNERFKTDLPDNVKSLKKVLSSFLQIRQNSSDKTFYNLISHYEVEEDSEIDNYIKDLNEKNNNIQNISGRIKAPIYFKVFNNIVDATNQKLLDYSNPDFDEEHIKSDEKLLSLDKIKTYLNNANSIFVHIFSSIVDSKFEDIENENNADLEKDTRNQNYENFKNKFFDRDVINAILNKIKRYNGKNFINIYRQTGQEAELQRTIQINYIAKDWIIIFEPFLNSTLRPKL